MPICLSVYLSFCLSVYLSICLSIYLSVYISLNWVSVSSCKSWRQRTWSLKSQKVMNQDIRRMMNELMNQDMRRMMNEWMNQDMRRMMNEWMKGWYLEGYEVTAVLNKSPGYQLSPIILLFNCSLDISRAKCWPQKVWIKEKTKFCISELRSQRPLLEKQDDCQNFTFYPFLATILFKQSLVNWN